MPDPVRAYRIVKARYAPGLDGEGAKAYPGRWNPAGMPMVYAASTVSLAILETFVHLPHQMRRPGALPPGVLVSLLIDAEAIAPGPDTALSLTLNEQREVGRGWLAGQGSVALSVPSHVVPWETNLLLNPAHPAFASAVTVTGQEPFRYDPRMVSDPAVPAGL